MYVFGFQLLHINQLEGLLTPLNAPLDPYLGWEVTKMLKVPRNIIFAHVSTDKSK